MCIPHGARGSKSNGYVQEAKPKKHIEKVSQEQFENGDPDFVDERFDSNIVEKKTWLEKLFQYLLG